MTDATHNAPPPPWDEALLPIRDALRGLRFGNVNVIIHDGVIVQIDRTERRRLSGNERKTDVLGN